MIPCLNSKLQKLGLCKHKSNLVFEDLDEATAIELINKFPFLTTFKIFSENSKDSVLKMINFKLKKLSFFRSDFKPSNWLTKLGISYIIKNQP